MSNSSKILCISSQSRKARKFASRADRLFPKKKKIKRKKKHKPYLAHTKIYILGRDRDSNKI